MHGSKIRVQVSCMFSKSRDRNDKKIGKMMKVNETLNKNKDDFWLEKMDIKTRIIVLVLGMSFSAFVAKVFFSSLPFVLLSLPLGMIFWPVWKKHRVNKRKELFMTQYKDLLYYLSVSLSAGKSLESAFQDAAAALGTQYGHGSSDLMNELNLINSRLRLREPIEGLILELAEKTNVEDVGSLADVIGITKRTGGNLVEVMQHSVRILREKIEIRREMETSWAAKKLEQRLLCVSPVFLILIIRAGSGDFLDPLYSTMIGRLIMVTALALIIFGFLIGERLMKVKI